MRVCTWALTVSTVAVIAIGCDGDPQDGCENAPCPPGQYCGSNGVCTFDCRVDADCAQDHKCNNVGRCVNPSAIKDMGAELTAVIKDYEVYDFVQEEGGVKPDVGGVPHEEGGVKKDTGGVKLDTGGVDLDSGGAGPDGGGAKPDSGTGTFDSGTTGNWDCAKIAACAAKCGSTSCVQSCTCKGTNAAQKKYQALVNCMQNASIGTCATACAVPGSKACGACVQKVCDVYYKACQFGAPTTGFGNVCSSTSPCASPYMCAITQTGATSGFCSKQCTTKAAFCSGAPSGTEAYCMISDGKGKLFCVFLCKYTQYGKPVTSPCPPKLTCNTKENPPGSGQHFCVP